MKPLVMELTRGGKQQFRSVGWKVPTAGAYRHQIYAIDESGKTLVVTLKPAAPEWYLPGFKAVFSREPFPEAVCVEILPCRLLPPPCYDSREAFFYLTAPAGTFVQDGEVNAVVEEEWAIFRDEHEKDISDVSLREEWAERNGEDLIEMSQERGLFRRWLDTHTGTRSNTYYVNTSERRLEITPPNLGEDHDRNPQFEHACGQVRWRAQFGDNAASVVFLADCEVRHELTAKELEEVAALEEAVEEPEDRIVKLDEAKQLLARPGKPPIQTKWLRTLCERAGVDCQFPMSRRQFERVRAKQRSQNRNHARTAAKNLPNHR